MKERSVQCMLRSPSSPLSDDGLDFDFFSHSPRITDTGISTEVAKDEEAYVVQICRHELRLARDPLVGTGGLLWPAGETLANYVCREASKDAQFLRDKRVLELGSGTGIVGLSIAKNVDMGHGHMALTDLEAVLPILRRNMMLNGSPRNVSVEELAWGTTLVKDVFATFDVFLLADCVYLESLFQPLIDTLLQLMIIRDQVGYLCYKKRRKADIRFFRLMRKQFILETIKLTDEVTKNGIQLYRFTRKFADCRV